MVGEALGLPGHQPAAAAVARNKLLTRERLRDSDLLVPWFVPTAADADPHEIAGTISYPCVVKPLSLSGSRGVIRADDAASFVEAFLRLRKILAAPEVRAERDDAHDTVLVEGFIEGWEFALEGLLHHGALNVLALFDKPDPLDGPFFEETIYVTPSMAPRRDAVGHRGRRRPRRGGDWPDARAGSRRVPRQRSGRLRPRGRGAADRRACAPGRSGSRSRGPKPAAARSRSRSCCCGTRSASRRTTGSARRRPPA